MQLALADPSATHGVALRVRCGLHTGTLEHRDNDYFGSEVNRGARIMSAAHGGQVIVSQAVVDSMAGRLPEAVTLRDLGSVRLRDLSRPERVYQIVHPQLRQDFPALRSLEATPNNLPQQVSSFVGREEVLQQVKKVFATTRLLTLLGVGGLGKTRLSLQLGADAMDDYPGRRVVRRAGAACRIRALSRRRSPRRWAWSKRPAVRCRRRWSSTSTTGSCCSILDNCEHLALAARRAGESAAPGGSADQGARDEPRVAAHFGRDDVLGAAARRSAEEPRAERRRADAIRIGAAVRRARACRASRRSR